MIFAPLVLIAAFSAGAHALVTPRANCPDGVTTVKNTACCFWAGIRDKMIDELFEGICGEDAHGLVRIAFHDAAGFSVNGGKGGGADGSIIQFGATELAFEDNDGIDDIVSFLQPFADANGITYGDAIQFGSSVALSLCPGAPRVQTFVGRKNATVAANNGGSLPPPTMGVGDILSLFADKGFGAQEVVALIASHSIAAQDVLRPEVHGSPFDSTPGVFDAQVYLETLLRGTVITGSTNTTVAGQVASAFKGELRLQSDHNLARDSRTACFWQQFALDQSLLTSKFSAAMTKLSLLGQSQAALTDCTEVIPVSPTLSRKQAFFPAGTTHNDIEQACATLAFPTTLSTQAGTKTTVAPVPTQ